VWAAPEPDRLRAVLESVSALDGVRTEVTTPAYRDVLMEMPESEPKEGEEPPAPPGFIGGNGLYADLDDALIERLVAFRRSYPASVVFLRSLGGAVRDVGQEDTAFPARTAAWFVLAGAFDVPGMVDDDTRAAIESDWREIEAGRLAEYGNFADTERPDAVTGMFSEAGFARLRATKAVWDPQNLFRRNHNILV
jgi:hypothetical protein